jgi:hypothetical protein
MVRPDIITMAWDLFQKALSTQTWDLGNYMSLVANAMEIANTLKGLTGPDKKEIVISTISKYVAESNDPAIKIILSDSTVSNLIETIIGAVKGVYHLKAEDKKRIVEKCFPCLI